MIELPYKKKKKRPSRHGPVVTIMSCALYAAFQKEPKNTNIVLILFFGQSAYKNIPFSLITLFFRKHKHAYLRGYPRPPSLPSVFDFNNFFNWSIKIRRRAAPKIYRVRRWPLRAFKLVSVRFIHETHTAYNKRVLAPDPICVCVCLCFFFCVRTIRIVYVYRIGYYTRTQ